MIELLEHRRFCSTTTVVGAEWYVQGLPDHDRVGFSGAGGVLTVQIGQLEDSRESTLSAVTRNGVMRLYNSGRRLTDYAGTPFSVRAADIQFVWVEDNHRANRTTLDESFPVARVQLHGGNDSFRGNSKANTINGGAGSDAIHGGSGNELIYGDRDPFIIFEGGSGDDTIYAGGGDDVVYGDEGTDRLFGEGGNDTLFGGAHKDFLHGGSGKNILVGGSGTDYFTVRPKDKTDREPRDHVTVLS